MRVGGGVYIRQGGKGSFSGQGFLLTESGKERGWAVGGEERGERPSASLSTIDTTHCIACLLHFSLARKCDRPEWINSIRNKTLTPCTVPIPSGRRQCDYRAAIRKENIQCDNILQWQLMDSMSTNSRRVRSVPPPPLQTGFPLAQFSWTQTDERR
jgi:hypothetical protein